MKHYKDIVAGDKLSQKEIVKALGDIAQDLMAGKLKAPAAGNYLEKIRFNMMDGGERQDDHIDALHAITQVAVDTSPEYSPAQIKALRDKTGLNQFDFADKLGVSRDTVNSWECGRRKPSPAIRKLLELIETGCF